MATGTLPDEGELRLGAVMLPPGRRIVPQKGPGEPVAWVTTQPVPDPGLIWSALSDAYLETGLVPVVLTDGEKDEDFFFAAPDDLAELEHLDAASVLGMGLAPHEASKLSMAECQQVLGSLSPAPIGLVPARRRAAHGRLAHHRPVPDLAPDRGGPALLGGEVRRPAPGRGPGGPDTAAGREAAARHRGGRAGSRRTFRLLRRVRRPGAARHRRHRRQPGERAGLDLLVGTGHQPRR